MNGTDQPVPKCAVCSKPAGQQCGGCRAEHYCGRVHQKQAWRAGHRLRCQAFRLDVDPVRGRLLRATRDIRQGEVLLRERPAVLGPKIVCYPTCLACYRRVPPAPQPGGRTDYYKCTSCGWPMCNAECEKAAVHKEECELMHARKYTSTITYNGEVRAEPAYCVITPLRCLLLQKSNPKQYEAIISLQSHLEKRITTPLYTILKANLGTFIQQVLGLTQYTDEEILTMAAILDTNTFDFRSAQIKYRGIYLTASMSSHDCNANTKHIFDENHCLSVVATVPIPKGAPLTTSYEYTQVLAGTLTRRIHLQTFKCFDCTCTRCSDPTECGTFMGSIYCTKCYRDNSKKDPHDIPKLVSTDPLNNSAHWKCQKCEHKINGKQIIAGNESLKKEIRALDRTNPREFEEFIIKYKPVLHPSNFHIVEAKFALSQMYGSLPGFTYNELNDAALSRKIELCEEVLELLTLLQPGWTSARGALLLEVQAALVVRARRELDSSKITKEAAQDLLGDCMGMLQEATDILRSEPDMQETLQQRLKALAEELNDDGAADF